MVGRMVGSEVVLAEGGDGVEEARRVAGRVGRVHTAARAEAARPVVCAVEVAEVGVAAAAAAGRLEVVGSVADGRVPADSAVTVAVERSMHH